MYLNIYVYISHITERHQNKLRTCCISTMHHTTIHSWPDHCHTSILILTKYFSQHERNERPSKLTPQTVTRWPWSRHALSPSGGHAPLHPERPQEKDERPVSQGRRPGRTERLRERGRRSQGGGAVRHVRQSDQRADATSAESTVRVRTVCTPLGGVWMAGLTPTAGVCFFQEGVWVRGRLRQSGLGGDRGDSAAVGGLPRILVGSGQPGRGKSRPFGSLSACAQPTQHSWIIEAIPFSSVASGGIHRGGDQRHGVSVQIPREGVPGDHRPDWGEGSLGATSWRTSASFDQNFTMFWHDELDSETMAFTHMHHHVCLLLPLLSWSWPQPRATWTATCTNTWRCAPWREGWTSRWRPAGDSSHRVERGSALASLLSCKLPEKLGEHKNVLTLSPVALKVSNTFILKCAPCKLWQDSFCHRRKSASLITLTVDDSDSEDKERKKVALPVNSESGDTGSNSAAPPLTWRKPEHQQ